MKRILSSSWKTLAELIAACSFMLSFFVINAVFTLSVKNHLQFFAFAEAILKGGFSITSFPTLRWDDFSFYQGVYYWPLGLLPQLVVVPFTVLFRWLSIPPSLGYLHLGFIVVIGIGCYTLARSLNYKRVDAIYLSFAFLYASSMMGVAMLSRSWEFAQVTAVAALILALVEYRRKRRPAILGLLVGLAFLSRTATIGAALFFILEYLRGTSIRSLRDALKPIVLFTAPILLCFALYGWYNAVRFDSVFEQGYRYQVLSRPHAESRAYGLVSPVHIPGNLYHLLLAGPTPVFRDSVTHVLTFPFVKADPWGMSILVTSPYLLYLLVRFRKDRFTTHVLASVCCIAVPILLYYGIGYYQFGYRYALDFFPLLFLLFISTYRENSDSLSLGMKLVILGSALLNFCFFIGLIWPQL